MASAKLERELRAAVEGEVRFDDGSRALYATDSSNYRQTPVGVVLPKSLDDVVRTIASCRKHGVPVLSRGGGTSLAGQCCNVAVVIDFSKYLNRVLALDPTAKLARVEPGTILDDLRNQAEKHHLTFGPDPSTHNHCTLGGMIGNNSCGVHAQMAGRTSENVRELDILTIDGLRMKVGPTSPLELAKVLREGGRRAEIYRGLVELRDRYANLIRARYPKIPRRISGYNLDELLPENGFNVARALVGSEGTCVTVLEATVGLVHSPPARSLLVLGYESVYEAADHVTEILPFSPTGLEGMDDVLVKDLNRKGSHPEVRSILPDGNGWLLIELGGETPEEADDKARKLMARLKVGKNPPSMKLFDDREEEKRVWKIREAGLGATARTPGNPDTWEGWEDSAAPPERLGEYLRELRKLFEKHGYGCSLYGHFGQGCVHTRIDFDLLTAEGIRKWRSFMEDATDLIMKVGGSFSGEHGDGQSRAEFLPKMFGPELVGAFREFKRIWDPPGLMNPGKIVEPYRIDQNLRLGTTYSPPERPTHFKFPEDKGSMPYATLRCVGVGECRRLEGGTMCPSFMVTREERHSTRGRAHLLNEMLRGDSVLRDGWKSEAVKEALDLCLACKGCKSECPVNVDMATYKAEFLSHYYQGRPRPRTAYAMGLIDVWAALASRFPRLANFVTQTPGLSHLAKALAGIAPERQLPRFADRTFKDWFREHRPKHPMGQPVILWADTFNNFFHPDTAIAAVDVLEAAGYRVVVPMQHLCCGRPLYDFGMLDLAKSYLKTVLAALQPLIRAGVPVVGLEPSCVAVFRDELASLLPNELDGKRLVKQTFLLSEFLEREAPRTALLAGRLPALKAVMHAHCHHRSVLKLGAEQKLLKRMGIEARVPDSGCCGMAGSFGFEKEAGRYEVSMKVGERALLPAVRQAEASELVIANGFSCREQIRQGTQREALHLAEVAQAAVLGRIPAGPFPEREIKSRNHKRLLGEAEMKTESAARIFDVNESYRRSLAEARAKDPERAQPRAVVKKGALAAVVLFAAYETVSRLRKRKAA